jgi:hypothetical protein
VVKEPKRIDEIKRLVQTGRYRVDPFAVADAMIRRGWTLLEAREPREPGSEPTRHLTGGNGAS